jgi:hypothetical protein
VHQSRKQHVSNIISPISINHPRHLQQMAHLISSMEVYAVVVTSSQERKMNLAFCKSVLVQSAITITKPLAISHPAPIDQCFLD